MAAVNTQDFAQRRYMEHRGGERVSLDLPVRLELAGELLAHGRLRNASISGALVATPSRFPILATVDVVLHTPRAPTGRLALPACVVRREDGALGLEWREMACESVVALLREADARAPLWRKDLVFS